MTDHLSNIENKKAQVDLGVFGARIYAGALEETGDLVHAFFTTVAFYRGMFGSAQDNREEGSEE